MHITKTFWFSLIATVFLMLCPTIGFSHIHINPILGPAQTISDFAVAWSSFQNLAVTLKATSPELRKKEDILRLQSLGSDSKSRLSSVQQNFQVAIQKIGESGNDTSEFDSAVSDELGKIPAASEINSTIRQLAGARATIRSFQSDALGVEIDNIIAEMTGGVQKTLKTTIRPSCAMLASLEVFGLVSDCTQCSDVAQKRFSEFRCSTR